MTCIVGFIDKNKKVWMGADSLGATTSMCVRRKDTKLFRNGKFLIGYTSSFRMGQLLRFKWVPPFQEKGSEYEFMCTKVIDSIRGCLKRNGYATIKQNNEEIGTFLIAYHDKLFKIGDDLQVEECVDNFNACGSGVYFATGALNILSSQKLSGKQICIKALETAEKFNPFVGKPFVVKKY